MSSERKHPNGHLPQEKEVGQENMLSSENSCGENSLATCKSEAPKVPRRKHKNNNKGPCVKPQPSTSSEKDDISTSSPTHIYSDCQNSSPAIDTSSGKIKEDHEGEEVLGDPPEYFRGSYQEPIQSSPKSTVKAQPQKDREEKLGGEKSPCEEVDSEVEEDEETSSTSGYLPMEVYATVVAAFSFLCVGLMRAYTSPAISSLEEDLQFILDNGPLSKTVVSWVAAAAPLGSFFGTILSGLLLQWVGRQKTLLLLSLPFIAGWLLIGLAVNLPMIITGRLLTGLAAGFSTAAAPMYVSECVRPQVRGFLGFLPAMMLSLGILLGFTLSAIQLDWRQLALLITCFPTLLLLFAFSVPESPQWLLFRGKEREAYQALRKLRATQDPFQNNRQKRIRMKSSHNNQGDHDKETVNNEVRVKGSNSKPQKEKNGEVELKSTGLEGETETTDAHIEKELEEMRRVWMKRHSTVSRDLEANSQKSQDFVQFVFQELLGRREIRYPVFISLSLMVFQQLSGAGAVIYYLNLILEESNPNPPKFEDSFRLQPTHTDESGQLDPTVASVIFGLVQFFAFFLSLPLIDRIGRRVLLMVSGLCMTFPHILLGLYFWIKANPEKTIHVYRFSSIARVAGGWLPLLCLCAFIAAFSMGFGPVPFVVMGEVFPSGSRAYMVALASLVNHLTLFFIVRVFPTFVDWLGPQIIFWTFAGLCFVAVLHVALFVPETKGKSLAQIELEFKGSRRWSVSAAAKKPANHKQQCRHCCDKHKK